MISKETLYKVLWATIEDFDGLWEIHWELNSLFPERSSIKNKEMAKKILQYFLEKDLVILYYSIWGSDELKEIEFEKTVEIINEEKFWDAPSINDVCVKVGSTEKGEKYYNEEQINDLIL